MKKTEEKNEVIRHTIKGVVTACYKGRSKFSKTEALRISIKFDEGQREKLVEKCEANNIYDNVKEGYIPDWYSKKDAEYINLKSVYPVACRVENTQKYTSGTTYDLEDDILAELGNINGSEVSVSVTLKEGAIYPVALLIKKLCVKDFDDLFAAMTEW